MIEEDLPTRLNLLGLHGVSRVVTHTNRSVMVSIGKRRVLRIHAGYAYASDGVLRAIVRFLDPRLPRAVRRAAERELLAFPVEEYASSGQARLRQERPRPGDLLLLHSDNARNWGSEAYWTGWRYPDTDACRRLVETGLSGIGFDGPSADPVDTTTFDLHKIWLGAGRLIIENMTNLGELPERVQVVVAPMKVKAANGAPARIFAFVPD